MSHSTTKIFTFWHIQLQLIEIQKDYSTVEFIFFVIIHFKYKRMARIQNHGCWFWMDTSCTIVKIRAKSYYQFILLFILWLQFFHRQSDVFAVSTVTKILVGVVTFAVMTTGGVLTTVLLTSNTLKSMTNLISLSFIYFIWYWYRSNDKQ